MRLLSKITYLPLFGLGLFLSLGVVISDTDILYQKKGNIISVENNGGSWSKNNSIILRHKYQYLIFDKISFEKIYEDIDKVEIDDIEGGVYLNIETSTGVILREKINI